MRPILALILSLILTVPAFALSGATADGEDRFPYVVEIKFEQRLVCSGTVLFPRIVVTAAHCLQHKARWPGGLVYIDEYAQAAELTVAVTRGNKTETYDVAEVTISPAWRSAVSASNTAPGLTTSVSPTTSPWSSPRSRSRSACRQACSSLPQVMGLHPRTFPAPARARRRKAGHKREMRRCATCWRNASVIMPFSSRSGPRAARRVFAARLASAAIKTSRSRRAPSAS